MVTEEGISAPTSEGDRNKLEMVVADNRLERERKTGEELSIIEAETERRSRNRCRTENAK